MPTSRIIQGIRYSYPEVDFALAWEADTENNKHNRVTKAGSPQADGEWSSKSQVAKAGATPQTDGKW